MSTPTEVRVRIVGGGAEPDTRGRRGRPGRAAVLVGLVVVVLLVVAVQRAYAWKGDQDLASDRDAAVEAAGAEVVSLISISADTSDGAIDSLLAGATAGFREDLEAQAQRLRSALTDNEVTAIGEIVSAGLSSFGDEKATVLVAARGTVENKQTSQAEPRNYRLQVSLQLEGERWLVSGLEFVA